VEDSGNSTTAPTVERALAQDEISASSTPLVEGYFYTLRAIFAYWDAQPQSAIENVKLALEFLPVTHRFLRGIGYMHYSFASRHLATNKSTAAD